MEIPSGLEGPDQTPKQVGVASEVRSLGVEVEIWSLSSEAFAVLVNTTLWDLVRSNFKEGSRRMLI